MCVNRSKFHTGETNGRNHKLIIPQQVGLQISYHLHPEVPPAVLYRELRKYLGEMFRNLAQQKECRIEEGHLLGDHVHMLISIPPKYAVAQVVGFIKGKSAIHLARNFGGRQRNFTGCNFWARGYYVSTVGRDEEIIGAISGSSRSKTNGLNNSKCSTSKGRL